MVLKKKSEISIRKAKTGDVAKLAELGSETFLESYSDHPILISHPDVFHQFVNQTFAHEKLKEETSDSCTTLFLLEVSSEIVGYAKLIQDRPPNCVKGETPIHLERLYLNKAVQGCGYGKLFINYCFEVSRKLGMKTCWLGVWDGNAKAISFYKKIGFTEVGSERFHIGSQEFVDTDLIFEIPLL